MDFMNLHQSAHGDREFAFIQTRLRRGRKTVVGHWQDPQVSATPRLVDAGGGRLARVAPAPDRAVRRQHARGRGHRGRQGRGAGPARLLGQRLRRRPTSSSGSRRSPTPRSTAWSTPTTTDYDVAPALRSGGDRHAELRTAARIEAGPAVVPRRRRLRRVHRHVRGPGRARAAAGHRRPAADGRRLRLRRRGRLEGRRAGADPQGDGRRPARRHLVHGGLHLPPGRPGPRGARRPHARGLPLDRRRQAVVRDPPAVDRRPRRPGAARVRRRARARRSSSASPTSATASGSSPTRSTSSSPTRRCRACRSHAPSGGRAPTSRPPPRPGSPPAGRTTPR